MLSLTKGTKLICRDEQMPNRGTIKGQEYIFAGYDESYIPKNKQNAVMTWYPDRPIWTEEEYVGIRYKFMAINLEGVESFQWLKDFDIA